MKNKTPQKDPAVLWYFDNWAGGTSTMTRHLKGCYMDLLNAQFNNGHLSLDEIRTVLGSDFGTAWPTLQKKFDKDNDGLYYNARLQIEKANRKNWVGSRRQNAKGKKSEHMPDHMGDGDGNNSSGFISPKDYLKLKSVIAVDEIEIKSGFNPADFDFHLTQWSLKVVGDGWEYSGDAGKDCQRLLAGLQKWINTCSRNPKNHNGTHSSKSAETISVTEQVKRSFDGIGD